MPAPQRTSDGTVAAVVVTYQPDEAVCANLPVVLAQADRVFVVDNGSPSERLAAVEAVLAGNPKAVLIRNPENIGLAAAQNAGIRAALDEGHGWILLLDQDSRPDDGMVQAMRDAYGRDPDPASVGMLAPHVYDRDQSRPTRYLVSPDGRAMSLASFEAAPVLGHLLFAIASGSLIPAPVLQVVGGMRDDFFIDYVDVEFSLRLRRHGYRILAVGAAGMRHRLGEYEERRLLWRTVAVTHHSALRRFYQYRNRVLTLRLYGRSCPAFVRWEVRSILVDLVRLLCFESGRWNKLRNALRGVTDGLRRTAG